MERLKTVILSVFLAFSVATMSQPATLPAVVDVTAIGAATYTIPIEVVPGTKGVQPSLAVAYNSVSGLGILGARWSLQGVSSIARAGQEMRFDGNIKAVAFDGGDRYALDGRRLLPVTGTDYNASGVAYCFEVEDFTRVEKMDENGCHYFRSILRDGTVVEYGRTSDSRLTPSGTDVLAWMADKVTDADGQQLTATQFRWSDPFRMEPSDIQIAALQGGYRVVAGNFDDDRIYDVIAISDVTERVYLLQGTPDGLDTDPRVLSHQISPGDFGYLRSTARAVDMDGDGVDELLYWNPSSLQWVVFGVTGTHLVQLQTVHMTSSNTFFADFDGDALPEMVSYTDNDYIYSKGFEGMADPNYLLSGASCKQAGDFDGDGKVDLLSPGFLNYRIISYDIRQHKWQQIETGHFFGIKSYWNRP